MAAEVTAGIVADSLALLSDAAHMLTDAIAIGLALFALRLAQRPPSGGFTYGLKRAEILSAQVNGVTLLLLGVLIVIEGVRRLFEPPDVEGSLVLIVALIGIPVNLGALRLIASAERRSLNVEGAFQHILTDLFAFIATAIAGRADHHDRLRAGGRDRLAAGRGDDAVGRLRPAARLRPGVHGGGAARARPRGRSARRWPPSPAWSRSTTCTSGR